MRRSVMIAFACAVLLAQSSAGGLVDAFKRASKAAAAAAPVEPTAQFLALVKAGDVRGALQVAPRAYAAWWTRLLQQSPAHVGVEVRCANPSSRRWHARRQPNARGHRAQRLGLAIHLVRRRWRVGGGGGDYGGGG